QELRGQYPDYFMAKEKIQLSPGMDIDGLLEKFKAHHKGAQINDVDGVKVDFEKTWVHLRKSNTEPIIRVYTEGPTREEAQALAQETISLVSSWA
ncbi:MAG: phosphoglucosamine mutase, partial [Bacteroidota bacterium]